MGIKEELKKSLIPGVIISIITTILLYAVSEALKVILPLFGKSSPFDLLQFFQVQIPFPLWATVFIFSIVIFTTAFSLRSISLSKKGGGAFIVKQKPLYTFEKGTYRKFNVDWEYIFGSFLTNLSESYSYVVSGPLCPKCKYEMDYKTSGLLRKKRFWRCLDCGTKYDVPKDVENVREAVEKFIDADFRKKRKL